MTNIARELVHNLRHDPHVRRHFSIVSWDGKGTCGTVGCIAGTAVAMQQQLTPWDNLRKIYTATAGAATAATKGDWGTFGRVGVGARILGLDPELARQLFLPDNWLLGLSMPTVYPPLFILPDAGHNRKPSAEYIEELKAWAVAQDAVEFIKSCTPDASANALEDLLDGQPYVDWKSAIEQAELA